MVRVQGCCCFSLKTGSLIIATLGWIGTILKLFSYGGKESYQPGQISGEKTDMMVATLGYRIGYAVVTLICCIMLVVGIYKKSANYFIPWLVIGCLEIIAFVVLTGLFFVFIFIAPHPGGIVFGVLCGICFCCGALALYFWLVIYSHYHEVKSGVVNVQTGPGGQVYYSPTTSNPPAYEKDRTPMA